MNIIIPICGIGKRFTDAGYTEPKPLITLFDKLLIEHVIDSINIHNNIFIIYHESLNDHNFCNIIHSNYPNIRLIPINYRTNGAAETVLYGINYILDNNIKTSNDNCLLLDCDTVYNYDIISKIDVSTNSVIYFEDTDNNNQYSYIKLDGDNNIYEITEKERISNNANTGAYYFKSIYELKENIEYVIQNNIKFRGEYYTSCVIKHMISSLHTFKGIYINKNHYTSLGTPDELKTYKKNAYGFLFDLDGTLVLTDDIYFNIWKEILQKYNITLTEQIFKEYIHSNSDISVVNKIFPTNTCVNVEDISTLKDTLFAKYINNITIIEGSCDFIRNLKYNGHRICIVTNCNRNTCELILKYMGIFNMIDYIVVGNECERPKPYPDPYKKAISLLNMESSRCIIFEDSRPGILSGKGIMPKAIIGINSYNNMDVLSELSVDSIIDNYINLSIDNIINNNTNEINKIKCMVYTCLNKKYNIKDIIICSDKLKGGYISSVIKVKIVLDNDKVLNSVLKYDSNCITTLSDMAISLGLYDREYYFYESISNYININVPMYMGTIKDNNFISKGILLEDLIDDNMTINLNLNIEPIQVSLDVIKQCAKLHSHFWNKDLSKSFRDLKKHNHEMFNPVWHNYINDRIDIFLDKWKYILHENHVNIFRKIAKKFNIIQEKLSKGHLTLCHGDVKSPNIFYKKNGESYIPYFIDWQYIANGKGVQDIVFFIIESFNTDNIKQYSELFKTYYYIQLKEHGIISYTYEEYCNDFKLAICYFPIFVAIWFGTTKEEELIDITFPFMFIQKLLVYINMYIDNDFIDNFL